MILLFKKFKKKSLKSKIAIIAVIAVLLALVAYVLYSNFKPEPPAEYELTEVSYGTITDTLDVSGTVESGLSEKFVALEGVRAQEVFVSVGDRVEKGDRLATFDVSGAAPLLVQAKSDYDKALKEYKDAVNSADSTAVKKLELADSINKKNTQIALKNKEISALQTEIDSSDSTTQQVGIPQEQINMIAAQMAQNGATSEQIEQFMAAASQVTVTVPSADAGKAQELMQKNLELAQLNSELASLQAENAVTVSTGSDTLLKALKSVADSKQNSYESLKAVYEKMENGWYAQNSGIITVVNIKPGELFAPVAEENNSQLDLSSLLGGQGLDSEMLAVLSSLTGSNGTEAMGAGITVESYEDMFVTVTVGKSDLLKIKTGMEAVIKSVGSEYEGEVVYVSATASESSGLDLGSITNSLMGGGNGNGAVVKIKIKNPDEKIVIGFAVDIKIKLLTVENVMIVPVETVIYNNGEYYTFVYDKNSKTVSKRKVVRGILDDTSYEIVSGLKKGDTVVKTPDPNFEDGTKIKEKTA